MGTIFEPGEDFPRNRAELEEWFATEEDCWGILLGQVPQDVVGWE